MTDAEFVLAAYGLILGGLVLYTLSLWRRLRAVRGFGMSWSGAARRAPDRDDEAR